MSSVARVGSSLRPHIVSIRGGFFRGEAEAHAVPLWDERDERSRCFLYVDRGRGRGTIRITGSDSGELEAEAQADPWRQLLQRMRDDGEAFAEITRFVVCPECRGSRVSLALIAAVLTEALEASYSRLFFAGKQGPLTRWYQRMGATVELDAFYPYRVGGVVLGHYQLLSMGRASARRAVGLMHSRLAPTSASPR